MGAKVQIENYMPGHYSMRDISHESNATTWPLCCSFLPNPFGNVHPDQYQYDKDVVKQTMLEHEAIFKNQVYELHRLYRVQRDLMDEVSRKEQFSRQLLYEASSSSSPVPSGLANSVCSRPSVLGHSAKGKNIQGVPCPRNSEVSESRPTKCRRRTLDLELPASEYVEDSDEVEQFDPAKVSENGNLGSDFRKSKILADLNEPIYAEEMTTGVSSAGSQHNLQSADLSKRFLSSFSYALETEQHKGRLRSVNQEILQQKPTVQACQPPAFLTGNHWKAKYDGMIEKSNRSSHIPNHQPGFFHYSDLGKSSDQCASSRGKKWNLYNFPVANEPFEGDPSLRNGFYQWPSTVCFAPSRFNYTNCNYNIDKKKPMRDLNLNLAIPNGVSTDHDIDHKSEHHKGICQNEIESSCNGEVKATSKLESNGCRKGRVLFDMNLPYEPESTDSEQLVEEVVIVEEEIQAKSRTPVHEFDLNSCIVEEETRNGCSAIKGWSGIDLEAPVMIGREDDELARSAAEAIVAMSSLSSDDTLRWFVGIACSSAKDIKVLDEGDENRVLDEFECMTLNLKECSFEEYFPKPSFPEIENNEETTGQCLLGTRTRRGRRQKRDFQRDILPGLTTLSRHEVTEDLQTFGGLMRATGQTWHSSPNRRNATRNGSARGRQRSVITVHTPVHTESPPTSTKEHISNAEVGTEDRSSLTGWGKTTRRPRRQRYPPAPGNPPLPVRPPLN